MTEKIRRDPSLFDSNDSLTPLSNGGQLWLVTRGEEYCVATSGLLRTRAKARTQTLKERQRGHDSCGWEGTPLS